MFAQYCIDIVKRDSVALGRGYCHKETFTFPPFFAFFQQRSQGSAADIVRAAAENKNNMAAKEEKLEKDNEKPAWLVEAEARRKLHEERRHPKRKEHGESQTSRGSEKTVINGPVLRSLPQRHEAVKDKSVSGEAMNVLHNVVLRPVRKPEAVPTNSDNDSDAT